MGSTTTYRAPGTKDVDWFASRDEVTHAHGTVNGVFYAAVAKKDDPDRVFARVIKMWRHPGARDGYNFTWKEMTESVGPVYCEAPAPVLDALTDTDCEYAQQWRDACRAHQARRAWIRENVRRGVTILLREPLMFSDNVARSEFTYAPSGSCRNRFVARDGSLVQLSRWRDRDFNIVAKGL